MGGLVLQFYCQKYHLTLFYCCFQPFLVVEPVLGLGLFATCKHLPFSFWVGISSQGNFNSHSSWILHGKTTLFLWASDPGIPILDIKPTWNVHVSIAVAFVYHEYILMPWEAYWLVSSPCPSIPSPISLSYAPFSSPPQPGEIGTISVWIIVVGMEYIPFSLS